MKVLITEFQRGFLFKKGVFKKMLSVGEHRYSTFAKENVVLVNARGKVFSNELNIRTIQNDPDFAGSTISLKLEEGQVAIYSVNGKLSGVLEAGEHCYWKIEDEYNFKVVNMNETEEITQLSLKEIALLNKSYYTHAVVNQGTVGVLYKDGAFQRELKPGNYFFWNYNHIVRVMTVDLRSLQLSLAGQEILTSDKIALRINFVCSYRITDAVSILNSKQNHEEEIYNMAQMALREHVGRLRLDQLLEEKENVGNQILAYLQKDKNGSFVEFLAAGIKDIILPGEIQDIMNTVLIAEKNAQASVITRREEVASTRSLLNTAKLMDENETLYKLKELEYIERIAGNVSDITFNGGNADMLAQLGNLLVPRKE